MPDTMNEEISYMTHEEISHWMEEIDACEKRKTAELKKRNHYPDLIRYYEGTYVNDQTDLKTGIKTKLAIQNEYFPNINTLISELLYQNPEITAEATKEESPSQQIDPKTGLPIMINNEDNAPILKSGLTWSWDKLDGLLENRIGLFDMLMAGFCAIEVNIVNQNPAPIPENPSLMDKFKKKLTGGEIAEKNAKEEPTREEMYTSKTKTFIRRWNPLQVGFDHRAERLKDVKYVYKIIKKTYAEGIAEYPELEGNVSAEESIPYASHANQQHNKTLTFYEVQRRKKNEVYETFLICKGYKYRELYKFDRTYTMNGFNMKIGVLDEYGALYPISRGQVSKTSQDDINNYLTHKMEVAERNIPKRWYNINKVKDTPEGLQALNNKRVMDNVGVDGGGENIGVVAQSNVSQDNNDLFMIFERQKEKIWGVSGQRLQIGTKPEFAEELKIQEAGFQASQFSLQEGLRRVIHEQLDTLKDIIVQLWDEPMWFKITGSGQPSWYAPQFNGDGSLANALPDILSLDYEVKVDIVASLRPNKEKQKKDTIEYLTWLIQTCLPAVLMPQGFTVNVEEIKKSAKEFGFSPENLIIQIPEAQKILEQAQIAAEQAQEESGEVAG